MTRAHASQAAAATAPTALPMSSTRFLKAFHFGLPAAKRDAWSLYPSMGALNLRNGLETDWRYTVWRALNIWKGYALARAFGAQNDTYREDVRIPYHGVR